MVRKKIGRRKGRRTKGYFFRPQRGWFTVQHGKFVPLLDEAGTRIRQESTEDRILKAALARILIQPPTAPTVPENDAEVGTVCARYLEHLRAQSDPTVLTGTMKTYVDRGQTLFDFCYGLPGEFFCNGDQAKRKLKPDAERKRLHPGFGGKLCSELSPADIDTWLKAHAWSKGGWRTRVQAVKRAMNFAVERKMIPRNPIKGYKVPKATGRITYLTPEQEEAMIKAASPAFAIALKVCIRTGARFGCEFAALTVKHVRDHGDRMEWVFKAEESKTKKPRIIRITDHEMMELVRKGMKNDGAVFLNQDGRAWVQKVLSHNFRRVKARIKKQGIILDNDACMYSCRHTYAKRTLEGFWTGKQTSINTLARLMGNTVQVCIDHYLQFSGADNEMLWTSA